MDYLNGIDALAARMEEHDLKKLYQIAKKMANRRRRPRLTEDPEQDERPARRKGGRDAWESSSGW